MVLYQTNIFSLLALFGIHGPFFILDKLSDVAESPRLADKMKYVFGRSRGEDESFAKLMRDLCFALRISLSKKRRLVAELEALGEQEGVAKPFEHMKEIVARDAVTLGELETLLTCAQVGVSLKASFVADMEERRSLCGSFRSLAPNKGVRYVVGVCMLPYGLVLVKDLSIYHIEVWVLFGS
ncbi:hypothetical protein Tco_1288755, partial [Tanacetum coccineum]